MRNRRVLSNIDLSTVLKQYKNSDRYEGVDGTYTQIRKSPQHRQDRFVGRFLPSPINANWGVLYYLDLRPVVSGLGS